jgi:hypothetical protein
MDNIIRDAYSPRNRTVCTVSIAAITNSMAGTSQAIIPAYDESIGELLNCLLNWVKSKSLLKAAYTNNRTSNPQIISGTHFFMSYFLLILET